MYCLQYDNEKIVSGLRDNTIKIWDKRKYECLKTLSGHTGSVLCLQYDENIIVSGSSDTTVRIWDIKTGANVQTLHNHKEAVLHLRFLDGIMVTCSKDRQIIVWDMHSPTDIQIKRTLVGHRAAVNVVDFDHRYIYILLIGIVKFFFILNLVLIETQIWSQNIIWSISFRS